MALTLDALQTALMVGGIVASAALNTWGIIRYMLGRIESQRAAFDQQLGQLRAGAVQRGEFDREISRLHTELTSVRDTVSHYGQANTARIDALIMMLGKITNTRS